MPHTPHNPRLLFFGTPGPFALQIFERLIAAQITPIAVVVPNLEPGAPNITGQLPPALRSPIPLSQPYVQYSLVESAWGRGVAVYSITSHCSSEVLGIIDSLQADLACVACFPWRIPPRLLRIPRYGFLNIHPSLLPAHRGPAPLFWTLWHGEAHTGTTIHAMDQGFDTGPIVAQQELTLAEGSGYSTAERQLATLGAELLISAIQDGQAFSGARRAQVAGGSYESWPIEATYRISQHWPARRAFICLRGLTELGQPFSISLPQGIFTIHAAHSYDPTGVLGQPYITAGDTWVQMSPGILRVRGTLLPTAK